jgi:exodeoxyribonuclease VII small subunit
MASKKPERMSFEESITELETIVSQLEAGHLPLDQAMKHYERGITLAATSHAKLEQAEQQIKILKSPSSEVPLADFHQDESV